VIEDALLERRLFIEKTGSRSTVVWNPWMEKGRRLADVGEDQVRDFVCVETANALGDVVTLPPGGEHRLGVVIRAEGY
jgi:D-hexose-6-phosphate mutarotase